MPYEYWNIKQKVVGAETLDRVKNVDTMFLIKITYKQIQVHALVLGSWSVLRLN